MAAMKVPLTEQFQISLRTILEVVAVAAFVFAILFLRMPAANSAGRYQVIADPRSQGGLIFIDTQTGKTWQLWSGQPL